MEWDRVPGNRRIFHKPIHKLTHEPAQTPTPPPFRQQHTTCFESLTVAQVSISLGAARLRLPGGDLSNKIDQVELDGGMSAPKDDQAGGNSAEVGGAIEVRLALDTGNP